MLALLRGIDLGKTYESGLIFKKHSTVFQDISLVVEEGKTLGLMGPSGSGKTTLGMIMAGLERPTAGHVCYQEKEIEDLQGKDLIAFRRQVQMVFQDPQGSLNPRKSIGRSIHEVLGFLDIPRREWQDRTKEALEKVGLSEELLCRYPGQISGGQCQRVALCRVLLLRPKVMILDEPTSALDISVQAQILNLLKDLQRDMDLAYLLVSHQPEVIRFMSHDTMFLGSEAIQ